MVIKKIKDGEIRLGESLPWPVSDEHGMLLLRKGYVINSQSQLNSLMMRGVYIHTGMQGAIMAVAASEEPQSPFQLMDNFQVRLRHLCESFKSGAHQDLPQRILQICRDIQQLCIMDADAALGAVHLVQWENCSPGQDLHVAILVELILRSLGLGSEDRVPILAAALTHDVGMFGLKEVLDKQTTPLSESQWIEVRLHPARSVDALRAIGVADTIWLDAVLHHHERLDGSGYPDGLKENGIPLSARVVGIADIYCALIKPRAHRKAMLAKQALRDIFLKRAGRVDERLAQLFVKELGVYPPGAFVKLHNSEIAIVTHRSKNGSCPIVQSVVGPRGAPLARPIKRDTSAEEVVIQDMVARDKAVSINLHSLWGYA